MPVGVQILRLGPTHRAKPQPILLIALDRAPPAGTAGQVGLEDRQTTFDSLVGLFGGLVGAARVTGGCTEVTDRYTLRGLCEHSKCNHTPCRVLKLNRHDTWGQSSNCKADPHELVFQLPATA